MKQVFPIFLGISSLVVFTVAVTLLSAQLLRRYRHNQPVVGPVEQARLHKRFMGDMPREIVEATLRLEEEFEALEERVEHLEHKVVSG